jgi:hypothetical protein
MELDDPRWTGLEGGYRVPFDPRPLLLRLRDGDDRSSVWPELWQELYHQGDVGVASYAALPQLCRIEVSRPEPDWQTYALVATICLARDATPSNPPIPAWLEPACLAGLEALARAGAGHLDSVADAETARSILAILALRTGLRQYARLLVEFDESEVEALERAAFG